MSALSVLLVGIIARGTSIVYDWRTLILGMITVFFITSAGNTINDYYDRESDKINHPERPIPAGKITPVNAVVYSLILFAIGTVSAYFISTCALLIASYAIFILLLYESSLKYEGFSGNISVSILVGMLFIFGGAIFGNMYLMVVFSIMAFFANLGREIIKDVEDIAGDINRKTLPKRVGKYRAEINAMLFIIAGIALSPLPYFIFSFSVYYMAAVLISDGIFIYGMFIQFKSPHKGQKYIKYGMIVGLLAYLIGGLT